MEQLLGIAVEQKIDSPHVNAEMIRLSEEHTVGQTTWNCLMRMTSYKHCRLRKFRGQRHYGIGKIIATGAHFQSHVATEHDRIYPLTLCARNGAADGFDRMLKLDSPREFPRKPKRHSRRRHSNDRKLDPRNFLYNERLDVRERVLRIRRCTG